ncbi:MAG: hypothetical protein U0163_11885 [Gemmatimonadaceae bacterium]
MTQTESAAGEVATPMRVTCIAADEASAAALAQLVSAIVPGADVAAIDPSSVRTLPDADCALVDVSARSGDVLQTLGSLRARGLRAPAICLSGGDDGMPVSVAEDVRARLGISHVLASSELPEQLPRAVRESTRLDVRSVSSPSAARALRLLRQTQRLLAAGEIAMRMQHRLNNPLAALLAEAQLLELEELAPDHRKAVERIIELSRRLIDVTRSLEGIGSR